MRALLCSSPGRWEGAVGGALGWFRTKQIKQRVNLNLFIATTT